MIKNALTIDVEDYFQVAAFEKIIRFSDWEGFDSHVCRNTGRLLDIFSEFEAHGTFFVLGWVAERYPALLQQIRERGHELACHGYRHARINTQRPEEFRQDIRLAKNLIEQSIGEKIGGYRAATFSIRPDTLWAFEILREEGFEYDSSVFPIVHDRYGISKAPRFPFLILTASGPIAEFPMTTIRILRWNLPASGGGYFRLLPYRFTKHSFTHINGSEGRPTVFYLHPWEIDSDQPRQKASFTNQFRHYTNIGKTEHRMRYLLRHFPFAPMAEVLRDCDLRRFSIEQTSPTHEYFVPADSGIAASKEEPLSCAQPGSR